MESNSKEIRLENEGIDRISDLPDSILCKILSYLPTKHVIGVSILSTRWKNLCPFGFMPITLNLHDWLFLNPKDNNSDSLSGSFIDFVDKLLNQTLSDVPYVEKAILKCEKNYGDAKVLSWVCAAVRLNVRHLDLEFSRNESIALFHSLNGCKSLVALRFLLGCEFNLLPIEYELRVPDNFSLHCLKSLDLANLSLDDEVTDPIQQLVQGCPAMEYLSLVRCNLRGYYDVYIRSPMLKNLVIEDCWEESLSYLVIDAPNLEVFRYNSFLAGSYHVCDFKSLHTAYIDVGFNEQLLDLVEDMGDDEDLWYFDNAAVIVSHCSSTIHLYLSGRAIDALNQSSMSLPVFQNLIWLSLGCLPWAVLARLLSIAPNLEQLTIEEVWYSLYYTLYELTTNSILPIMMLPYEIMQEKQMGFEENEGGFPNFKYLLPIPPECLVHHVKRIEFLLFKGDEDEMELVEYFLKNGEVLQNLKLHFLPLDDTSTLTRLLMLPRQSRTCQIECTRN